MSNPEPGTQTLVSDLIREIIAAIAKSSAATEAHTAELREQGEKIEELKALAQGQISALTAKTAAYQERNNVLRERTEMWRGLGKQALDILASRWLPWVLALLGVPGLGYTGLDLYNGAQERLPIEATHEQQAP